MTQCEVVFYLLFFYVLIHKILGVKEPLRLDVLNKWESTFCILDTT